MRPVAPGRERFRSALGSHPRPFLLVDAHGLAACNEAACELAGFSEQAMLDTGLAAVTGDPAGWDRRLAALLAGEEVSAAWVDLVRGPEGTRGAHVQATAVPSQVPGDTSFVAVVELQLSIDEPQLTAEARHLRQRYERLVDSAQEGIWEVDTTGCTVFANRRMAEILGCDVAELLGRSMFDFFDPEVAGVVERTFAGIREGNTDRFDARCRRPDGSTVWLMASAIPLFDDDGTWIGAAATAVDVTGRRAQEQSLRETEELLRRTFDEAAIATALVGPDGSWLRVNDAACRMLGRERAELVALTFQDITHPDDLDADLDLLEDTVAGRRTGYAMEKRYLRPTGEVVWATLTVALVRDDEDQPLFFVSQFEDITARKQAEAGMERANRRLQRVLDRAAVAMALVDITGTVEDCNHRFLDLFGGATSDAADAVPTQGRDALDALLPAMGPEVDLATVDVDLEDGRVVQLMATQLDDESARSWIVQALDVTHERAEQRRLMLLTERDPLTGVANRRGLRRQAAGLSPNVPVAVLYLDLDGFKAVNDRLGHDAGDRLLIRVARALVAEVRGSDLVVRLGGDEFAVLLQDCDIATAEQVAARINRSIGTGLMAGVTASVGVAYGTGGEVDRLVNAADQAMLSAKSSGKNRIAVA